MLNILDKYIEYTFKYIFHFGKAQERLYKVILLVYDVITQVLFTYPYQRRHTHGRFTHSTLIHQTYNTYSLYCYDIIFVGLLTNIVTIAIERQGKIRRIIKV